MLCWRQVLGVQNHDFGMGSVIPSDFLSTFLELSSSIFTIFFQIFVGQHVFLPNESTTKRLATCIRNFRVEYHNFTFKSVNNAFVLSFWTPLSCSCGLARCIPISCQISLWVHLTVNRLFQPTFTFKSICIHRGIGVGSWWLNVKLFNSFFAL